MELLELFIEYFKTHPRLLIVNLMLMMLVPINEIYLSRLYAKIFTDIQNGTMKMRRFWFVIIVIALLQIGFGVADFVNTYQSKFFNKHCKAVFLNHIFNKFSDRREIPHVNETMSKLNKVQQILGDWFSKLFGFIFPITIQIVFTLFYITSVDRVLGIVTLGLVLAFVSFIYTSGDSCRVGTEEIDKVHVRIQNVISDVLENYLMVYKENTLRHEMDSLNELYEEHSTHHLKTTKCTIKYRAVLTTIIVSYLTFFFTRCFKLIHNKNISKTVLYGLIMIMTNMTSNMIYLVSMHRDMVYDTITLNNSGLIGKVYPVYASNHTVSPKHTVTDPNNIMEIRNLSVVYPGSKKFVLRNMNMHIKHKEKVAMTGPIGSGKTTLLKAILRITDLHEGIIYVKGYDIHSTGLRQHYNKLAFMPQNAALFNRSVLENIRYENRHLTEKDVRKTLIDYDLIHHFPNGLHVNASTLSGGQRQLVWLLKIHFKGTDLIIMDEPTASLDKVTKDLFITLLNTMMKDASVLIITHDPYMAKHCDRVVDIRRSQKQ